MNHDNTQLNGSYFEEIGAWPSGARHIGATYAIGFIVSIILTLASYVLVIHHAFLSNQLIVAIAIFAILQFITQMLCFLHISKDKESRPRLIVLGFAALVVCILVVGSLWIMTTLNGRMMPSQAQMDAYMSDQDGGI